MTYFHARVIACAASLVLAGCGDSGGSAYCAGGFSGGGVGAGNVCLGGGCSIDDEEEAIDGSSASSARFDFPASGGEVTIRATAPDTFPAGANPGALIKFPEVNLTNSGVSFTLYKDGAVVSSASGGASVTSGEMPGAGEKTYYGDVSTPVEFDAVEAQITISGNAEPLSVRVYEICGDN